MAADLPSVSYLALYIVSVHLVNTKTSTHWKLNLDSGKVEDVVAMAASGDPVRGVADDPLLSLLASRVATPEGEWRLDAGSSSSSCHKSCRTSPSSKPEKAENNSSQSVFFDIGSLYLSLRPKSQTVL